MARVMPLGVVLLALLLVGVRADIPAHCLHSQVLGEWELSLSADTFDRHTARCGDKETFPVEKKMRVTLLEPDRACLPSGECGFWTMVYDQGWEIQLGGASYFAFSKYEERSSSDEWGDTRKEIISHCGFTSTGWFHRDDNTHWGCYTARKVNTTAPSSYFVGAPPTLDNVKFEQDASFIAFLNEQDLGWEATHYADWEGMPLADVITRAGGNPHDALSFLAERADVRTRAREHARRHHHHHHGGAAKARGDNVLVSADPTPAPHVAPGDPHADAKYAGLPRRWDWREVKEVNYENPARAQHSCGSCYAFAYLSAVETRIALATDNHDHTMLSPQHILSCNPYSQGCKGGFPYLVGKFGQDYGFVPDTCLPYEAIDLPCARNTCDESVLRYVRNYTYIGGYYGAGNEVDMMWEIYRKGPIPTAFEVEAPFYHYRSGVFEMPTDTSYRLKDKYNFIKTNHGVTIVGWDIVDGKKAWICKNTWGSSWGMGGYFYFKRGEDMCGMESMTTTFDLVL